MIHLRVRPGHGVAPPQGKIQEFLCIPMHFGCSNLGTELNAFSLLQRYRFNLIRVRTRIQIHFMFNIQSHRQLRGILSLRDEPVLNC